MQISMDQKPMVHGKLQHLLKHLNLKIQRYLHLVQPELLVQLVQLVQKGQSVIAV